jgi:hypothetical protein
MYPWPYLDRAGFTLRSVMPATDVALVATVRPGYIESQLARAQSYFEARARKNYRRSLPLGGSAPPISSIGTSPPQPNLIGTPTIGSMRLALAITTPGADGSAQFKWSLGALDATGALIYAGSLASVAVNFSGAGYTVAPSVVIDAPPQGGTQATATAAINAFGVVTGVSIVTPGTGYTSLPNVTLAGGGGAGALATATAITPIPVAIPAYTPPTPTSVFLSPTGLSVVWPAGVYSLDNFYQAPTPVPEVVLQWLTQMVTPDVYNARGRNPADPYIEQLEADRTRVLGSDGKGGELHEFADGENGLIDIPIDDAQGSAVTAGPLAYSETSPYVAFDRERHVGEWEDRQRRGSFS